LTARRVTRDDERIGCEHAGCGIGPRNVQVVEADGTVGQEGIIKGAKRRDMFPEASSRDSTGVEEPGREP
jgi:hypothetical protein